MKYEELKEGDVFTSPKREITEEDINAFAELTGDNNEIHTSEEYAKKTSFGTRIAHGIAVGQDIEYADIGSLTRALADRREL